MVSWGILSIRPVTVWEAGFLIDSPGSLEVALWVSLVVDGMLMPLVWVDIVIMVVVVIEFWVSLVVHVVVDIVMSLVVWVSHNWASVVNILMSVGKVLIKISLISMSFMGNFVSSEV